MKNQLWLLVLMIVALLVISALSGRQQYRLKKRVGALESKVALLDL